MNKQQFLICAIIDNGSLKNGTTFMDIKNKLVISDEDLRKILYELKRKYFIKYRFKKGNFKYVSYATTEKFFKFLKLLDVVICKETAEQEKKKLKKNLAFRN
jgi:transcription initiation factor IIE alpha subunit